MSRRLVFALTVICAALVALGWSAQAGAQCRTYSTPEDFELGLTFNLMPAPGGSGGLVLDTLTTPFPYINIAASGRGTMIRVDVTTGAILGEYWTSPDGRYRNPSRTTVDLLGNVWVTNRDEADGGMGSVTRIGLIVGGTRCDADGTPNPAGQYLAPPFLYSTVTDRDGDGLIKTSYGLGNVLAWTNAGGADNAGGVSTAEDELIINYVRVNGANTRTVAIDANNNAWVGGYNFSDEFDHDLIDGATGAILQTINTGCGGYGGLVDGNGVLWSADLSYGSLMRYDPSTNTGMCIPLGTVSYGLGIDGLGNIWNSTWTNSSVHKISPAGAILATYPLASGCYRGVVATADNNIWIANSCGDAVVRLDNNGNLLATIPVGSQPTGVAVDAYGKVWVTNLGTDNAMRIDPATNLVDLTVHLGGGAYPYNYSDMTGFVSINSTAPQGSWTVGYDGGDAGTNWGKICWNEGSCPQPEGTSIEVRVRSSEDQLTWSDWVTVVNCEDFEVPDGRYLQVEMKLIPNEDGESPLLCNVTVCTGIVPVAIDIKPTSCPNPFHLKPDGTPVADYNVLDLREIHSAAVSPSDKSVLPVAVLGTADFDVTLIDPESVTLAGVSPLRWALEDVAAPLADPDECECTTAGPDGYLDLTLKFNRAEIAAALGPFADGDYIPLELLGELSDGRQIQGFDCVWIKITGRSGFASADDGFGLNSYPNPFNARTTVSYRLDNDGPVELAVFNVLGQRVATLVDEFQPAGEHSVVWDGGNAASGTYFYRLSVAGRVSTRMMTLLK